MIVIYCHIRLEVNDIHSWGNDALRYDRPIFPVHVITTLEVFKNSEIWFYTVQPDAPLQLLPQRENLKLFQHTNYGHDFAIYKTGILKMLNEGLEDNLIIMNDSCMIIPENMYRFHNTWMNYDFLGITYYYAHHDPHLQSYFMFFTKRVVKSKAFREFWESVNYNWSMANAIIYGECQLTQHLVRAGFDFGYYCKFNGHFMWGNPDCWKTRTPVLKIKQNEDKYNYINKLQLA